MKGMKGMKLGGKTPIEQIGKVPRVSSLSPLSPLERSTSYGTESQIVRDEDLKNLPQTVEAWKVREMLEQLGFGDQWKDVRRTVILPRSIHVDVLATDETGHRYWVDAEDGTQQVAEHKISIPFVGSWEKPTDVVAEPKTAYCGGEVNLINRQPKCTLDAGHNGEHWSPLAP